MAPYDLLCWCHRPQRRAGDRGGGRRGRVVASNAPSTCDERHCLGRGADSATHGACGPLRRVCQWLAPAGVAGAFARGATAQAQLVPAPGGDTASATKFGILLRRRLLPHILGMGATLSDLDWLPALVAEAATRLGVCSHNQVTHTHTHPLVGPQHIGLLAQLLFRMHHGGRAGRMLPAWTARPMRPRLKIVWHEPRRIRRSSHAKPGRAPATRRNRSATPLPLNAPGKSYIE